ncbi:MAG: DEAD/DEAH box helicase [Anaerolineae bacterium]|nr:DEAD/DEAH box helicase [Anaerolineae bacterium]
MTNHPSTPTLVEEGMPLGSPAQLGLSPSLAAQVTLHHIIPAQPARYAEFPPALAPQLRALLHHRGIPRLYTHQAKAVQLALEGQHILLTTPTASGKTLAYALPLLQALLQDPLARSLLIFPTKALAHDQLHILRGYLQELGLSAAIATYDGDTPFSQRSRIRRSARLLLTNPDMLHMSILPNASLWREFFAHLTFIVLDEVHSYRGVFGSHVANVLRRLKRICQARGNSPQFLCSSATIANPQAFAQKLLGLPVALIQQNGAPQGEKHILFYNPPILDPRLGIRRSPLEDARLLGLFLLQRNIQTVIFARSRAAVERLVLSLRAQAAKLGFPSEAIRGYRAGYLPEERRSIERGLREGSIRLVVATSALELGIDLGELEGCILAGYPGSIASTWQRIGRVGRSQKRGIIFLIAGANPLDQYLIAHPEYLLEGSPEQVLIHPDNLHILIPHLQCAAYELPLEAQEIAQRKIFSEALELFQEMGLVRPSGGRWFWIGPENPARAVSLRATEAGAVKIIQQDTRQVIGEVDRAKAPFTLHKGAIYLHEGERFLVRALDWEARIAWVEPTSADYYTEASQSTRISIEHVLEQRLLEKASLFYGELSLTMRVTGYKRLHLSTGEHLGWGEVHLPEQHISTTGCWLTIPDQLIEKLRQEGLWTGERPLSRGPNWEEQRNLARQRDGYRCRWCGAPERPGRQHEVHHIVPFREFGWVPGENENYRQANRLSNLITLCPRCHRLAEQQVAVRSTLSRLGRVLRQLIPLLAHCDAQDVGISSELRAPQTKQATLFIFDRLPGGVGISEKVYLSFDTLLQAATELVRECPCASGCPSCIGPTNSQDPSAKRQVLHLIGALQNQR